MCLQRYRPVSFEVLPNRLWLVVVLACRVHTMLLFVHHDVKLADIGIGEVDLLLLLNVVLAVSVHDDVLVLEDFWIGLPVRVDEDSSTPNWKLLLAGVQSERVGRVPASQLGATSRDFDYFTRPSQITVQPELNCHHGFVLMVCF